MHHTQLTAISVASRKRLLSKSDFPIYTSTPRVPLNQGYNFSTGRYFSRRNTVPPRRSNCPLRLFKYVPRSLRHRPSLHRRHGTWGEGQTTHTHSIGRARSGSDFRFLFLSLQRRLVYCVFLNVSLHLSQSYNVCCGFEVGRLRGGAGGRVVPGLDTSTGEGVFHGGN